MKNQNEEEKKSSIEELNKLKELAITLYNN